MGGEPESINTLILDAKVLLSNTSQRVREKLSTVEERRGDGRGGERRDKCH